MKDYYALQHVNLEADETTLTIRAQEMRRIPVEQIQGLHLLAGYALTSGVVDLASKHSFPIHFYGFYGGYRGSYLPPSPNTTAGSLIQQVVENQDASRRLRRSLEIFRAMQAGMETMLEPFGLKPPPLGQPETLEDLRLQEARIRKEYYALCDTILPPFWSIVKRERRPPQRPADAVLSFANGILYAKTAGWIHRAGLDPRIGYIHGDARASNPLALDLAEILKPFLSEGVLFTLAATGNERSLVTEVGEGCYLNEKGRKAVIQIIESTLTDDTQIELFGRALTLGRVGELIPTKLHRAVITGDAATYPIPSCTLSSSTTRILNERRLSVDSS